MSGNSPCSSAAALLQPIVYGTLLRVCTQTITTLYGDFAVQVFHNLSSRSYALAVCRGDLSGSQPLLSRVHSSCLTSEFLGGCDCDCAQQLHQALARIAVAGRGVLFYLPQEGRGAGYSAKARDRMIVQASRDRVTTFDAYAQLGLAADPRHYSDVAAASRMLGITAPLHLLTNNPSKLRALREAGVAVTTSTSIQHPATAVNAHYLAAKRAAGHQLGPSPADSPRLLPPESRPAASPHWLAAAPHLLAMGSYLLPILLPPLTAPIWLRSYVYFDLRSARERVVLTYGEPGLMSGPPTQLRIQEESLFDRLPCPDSRRRRQWQATLGEFQRCGQGIAILPSADGYDAAFAAALRGAPQPPAATWDDSLALLVKHHAGAAPLTPLWTSLDDPAQQQRIDAQLFGHGLRLAPPTLLPLGSR